MSNTSNQNSITDQTTPPQIEQDPIELTQSDKEKQFLDVIVRLENEKKTIKDTAKGVIERLKKDYDVSKEENFKLQNRIELLQKELKQAMALGGSNSNEDDMLLQVKTLLFEKTKVCQQQEQQMKALNEQVSSLKEVLGVTKEMLNLRNTETEFLQGKFDSFDLRLKAGRDRADLLEKKLAISTQMYSNLKNEYDIQKNIFTELKQVYEEKIKALSKQMEIKNQ